VTSRRPRAETSQEFKRQVSEGCEAFQERQWQRAFDILSAADAVHPLAPDALERLAWAARWTGRYAEWTRAAQRTEKLYVEAAKPRQAARMAVYLAQHYLDASNEAVSQGYAARASRLLEQEPECAEHGLEAWLSSWHSLAHGEIAAGHASAERAVAIGRKLGDRSIEGLGTLWLGRALIAEGRCEEGIRLQDEACALATSSDLDPFSAGIIFCTMIHGCVNRSDWRRAVEWTDVLGGWIDRESVSWFPGLCRLHQAEVHRLRGALREAEAETDEAVQALTAANPRMTGWAYGELAEIRLRRGDLEGAGDAIRRALELGVEPQPVSARLRLAQGDSASALRMIQRAAESSTLLLRERRVTILPVFASCAIASGNLQLARLVVEELDRLAAELATLVPLAEAACSRGELLLAEDRLEDAAKALRTGRELFREIDAPLESARAQTLLADALERQGDPHAAALELKAALSIFHGLDARLDMALVTRKLMRLPGSPALLPQRQVRTFMFTDIVDSTKLLDAVGDNVWERLRNWHDRTVRECFECFEGVEVDHAGDGFFVAFATTEQALQCAIAVQRRLAEQRDAQGFAPEVRIGVHAAEASQVGSDYTGKGVHEAARIASVAAAGEIAASRSTLDSAVSPIPYHQEQEVRLKGLSTPLVIAKVVWRRMM
jgi:class 3 adenylate cyclase